MFGNASEIDSLSSKTPPEEILSEATLPHDLVSSFSPKIRAKVLEYAKLSAQGALSESEADCLEQILTIAAEDEELNFWLTEIDHVLGHEMGFLTDEARQSYEDQQALLREHHGDKIPCLPVPEALRQRAGKVTCIHGEYSISES
jgi:hypothetical protein